MKLSKEAFQRARHFVDTQARPIDQALLAIHFDGAGPEHLTAALAAYQNEDGGFGRSLEPDFRLTPSSALATAVAFTYLRQAGVSASDPLVRRAVSYLLKTVDDAHGAWEPVPAAVDTVPRAPWWGHALWRDQALSHWPNPSAECLAILLRYGGTAAEAAVEALTAKAREALAVLPRPCDMHVFLSLLVLAESAPPELRTDILTALADRAPTSVGQDAAAWENYSLRPYWVVSSPRHPLYKVLRRALSVNLDYEITHQQEDGSWAPFWAWGQYEDDWRVARREWAGHLTVKLLIVLEAFGRIARR